ncbi:hypothetical protein H6F89_15505 [Cyanobacteria bacterium FACHB-63]|nr:hypothetical protein [Cyanobacteria bacterium FACHB-63]
MILVVAIGIIPLSYVIARVSDEFRLWQAGGKWCVRLYPGGRRRSSARQRVQQMTPERARCHLDRSLQVLTAIYTLLNITKSTY